MTVNKDEPPLEEPGDERRLHFAEDGERRGNSHLWLISYSDFMTILMIFFLMMYVYTTYVKSIARSKRQAVSDRQSVQELHRLQGMLGPLAEVEIVAKKLRIQMRGDVLFDSGNALLKDTARKTLKEVAAQLKGMPGDIIVEGHTDDVPITRGPYPSNWELSAARAFSVIDYFSHLKVPLSRLSARGYAEYKPRSPGTDALSRQKNRRIEIILVQNQESVPLQPEDWSPPR